MMDVASMQYWHWLGLGLLLLVADVLLAGTSFLMWIGFAALATGLLALLLPIGYQWQLVIFGVASIASVLLWRRYVKDVPAAPGAPLLNQRGAQYIGRVVHLEEAIVGGQGRIRLDDTLWSVRGPDLPAGSHVRIRAQDGNVFDVDPA